MKRKRGVCRACQKRVATTRDGYCSCCNRSSTVKVLRRIDTLLKKIDGVKNEHGASFTK